MDTTIDTAPRRAPRQKRSAAKVEALLEATAECLVSDGYDRTSTNRIARRAGVSIGTLYQYFPSKEALVLALSRRQAEREAELVRNTLSSLGQAPLREVARRLIDALLLVHRDFPDLQRVLLTQVPLIGGLASMREFDARSAEVVRAYLAERFPKRNAARLELMTFVSMHAVEGLIHQALLARPEYLADPAFADELSTLVVTYLEA